MFRSVKKDGRLTQLGSCCIRIRSLYHSSFIHEVASRILREFRQCHL